MRLGALTTEMVQKAIAVYQDLAYGTGGRPRRPVEPPTGGGVDSLLAMFQKEQVETIPGYPCHRYSLRQPRALWPNMDQQPSSRSQSPSTRHHRNIA